MRLARNVAIKPILTLQRSNMSHKLSLRQFKVQKGQKVSYFSLNVEDTDISPLKCTVSLASKMLFVQFSHSCSSKTERARKNPKIPAERRGQGGKNEPLHSFLAFI